MSKRTTKRATSGSRAPKKAAAKKAAPKKGAKKVAKKVSAKTATTKRTTKKSTKKAAKKAAPKKQTAKKKVAKKATKKVVTKADSTTETDDQFVVLNQTVPKKEPQNGEVTIGTTHKARKTKNGFTIFSRVKTDTGVLLVARILGFVFILTGAFFTLIGLNRAYDISFISDTITRIDASMRAQALDPCSQFISEPMKYDECLTSTVSETAPQTQTEDSTIETATKPTVQYDIPPNPLSDKVDLVFNVHADAVQVRLINYATKKSESLGSASGSSDKTIWKVDLDTQNYLDGEYGIKLIISENGGTYYDEYGGHLQFENVSYAEDHEHTVTDTASSSDESMLDDSVVYEGDAALETHSLADLNFAFTKPVPANITALATYNFALDPVAEARLFTKHVDESSYHEVKSLRRVTTKDWEFTIDPTNLSEGKQVLLLQIKTSSGETHREVIDRFEVVTIVANTATTTQKTTDTISDESDAALILTDDSVTGSTTNRLKTVTVTPTSIISVTNQNSLLGIVPISAETAGAQFAEFYVRPTNSLRDQFIGLGTQKGDMWIFEWDTRQTPNGTYYLFAKHRNQYGDYFSNHTQVAIENSLTHMLSVDEEKQIDDIIKIADEFEEPVVEDIVYAEPKFAEQTEPKPSDLVEVKAAELLQTNDTSFDELFAAYSQAVRTGDIETATRIKRELTQLRETLLDAEETKGDQVAREDLTVAIAKRIDEYTAAVDQTEEVVRNRVGDAVTNDTDNDGITDYDEITIYKTNPRSADTDGDGFTDEAEILGGYDPTSDIQEAAIVYQSPRESGVVREDVFSVDFIAPDPILVDDELDDTSDEGAAASAPAIISGKGLPNSYVTIYIFSTPIVVTVRTTDDGSWSYRFDKELEDGEHEVYVGVTDNSGKLVAKSNPFTFVKEAQAFTPVDAEAAAATVSADDAGPSLMGGNALIVALAAVIMSLGFVLLMISFFLRRKEDESDALVTDLVQTEAHVA